MITESSLPQIDEEGNDFNHKKSEKIIKSNICFGGWNLKENKPSYTVSKKEVTLNDDWFLPVFEKFIINNPDSKSGKKKGDFFLPFDYAGKVRSSDDCIGATMFVYDIDGMDEKDHNGISEDLFNYIVNNLDFGYKFALYESHSSVLGKRKLRLIVPLKNVLSFNGKDSFSVKAFKSAYKNLWHTIIFPFDPDGEISFQNFCPDNCSDLARLFFSYREKCADGHEALYQTGGDIWDYYDAKEHFDYYLSSGVSFYSGSESLKEINVNNIPDGTPDSVYVDKDFEIRDRLLIAKINQLCLEEFGFSRNKFFHDWVWREMGYYREVYSDYEFFKIKEYIINLFSENKFNSSDPDKTIKSVGDYKKEIEKTFDSAMKNKKMGFGYDGTPFKEFRTMTPLQKDIYFFITRDKRWNSSLLMFKENNSEIMESLGKEVVSKHIKNFSDCYYEWDIKTNIWIRNEKSSNLNDFLTNFLNYFRLPLDFKFNLLSQRISSEELFLKKKAFGDKPVDKKDLAKILADDKQYCSLKSRAVVFEHHKKRLASTTGAPKNLRVTFSVEDVTFDMPSNLWDGWCDKYVPAENEHDKVKLVFKKELTLNGRKSITGEVLYYDPSSSAFKLRAIEKNDFVRESHMIATDHGGFNPDVRYENKVWDSFINNIFANEESRDFLKMACGAGLLVDLVQSQIMLILYGPTSNGKSVFFDIMHEVFGQGYSGKKESQVLFNEEDTSKPDPSKAGLNDSRITVFEEFKGKDPNQCLGSVFKKIVGGCSVNFRLLNQSKTYSITKKGLFMASLNYGCFPKVVEDSKDAIWRRNAFIDMPFIHFDSEKNPKYDKKNKLHRIRINGFDRIVVKAGRNAIIQWFLDGALKFFSDYNKYEKDANDFSVSNEKKFLHPIMNLPDSVRETGITVEGALYSNLSFALDDFLVSVKDLKDQHKPKDGGRVILSELVDLITKSQSHKGLYKNPTNFRKKLEDVGITLSKVRAKLKNNFNWNSSQDVYKNTTCLIGYVWKDDVEDHMLINGQNADQKTPIEEVVDFSEKTIEAKKEYDGKFGFLPPTALN